CALWKKQTTLPSLAYAGIPYQVFGDRPGAVALTIAWSRSAMARSGPRIAAIFASTSLSPSALSLFARAAAFSSWARSFIAARSHAVVLARSLETDVVRLVGLRWYAEKGGVYRLGRCQVGHGMQHALDSLAGRAGHDHS